MDPYQYPIFGIPNPGLSILDLGCYLKVPYEVKAGLFLSTAAGIGILAGFGTAVASTKKQVNIIYRVH